MNYAFGEASFEYFESCNFSRENTNIDVSAVMFDLRMINMSSECEYKHQSHPFSLKVLFPNTVPE
jgi:hypothetical protein